jgi:uncharacterized membrane protein YidH (DUF202 family)
MNGRMLIAVLLIVFGVIALAYGRVNYTRNKTVVDLGPVEINREEHKSIPLPPVLGAIALASGVTLVLWPRNA